MTDNVEEVLRRIMWRGTEVDNVDEVLRWIMWRRC